MKTKDEIKNWLLENAVDKDGNLDLDNLDFSNFDGDIYIGNMKVKKNLFQSKQKVDGSLFQGCHEVQGDLFQHNQEVKGNLHQGFQEVKGNFITQTLKDDEEYEINKYNNTYIVKKTKKLTYEELKKIVGCDFEIVEKED